MKRTELQYRTFDQLVDEVSQDFKSFSSEGMIDPSELIKVAQRVTYDLGLRIHQTKETMIEVNHGKAKLPSDFYVLNHALLCHKYKVKSEVPMGRHTEDVLIPDCCEPCTPAPPDPCAPCPDKCQVSCRDGYQVVQTVKHEVRVYDETERIRFTGSCLSKGCPNKNYNCGNHGEIKNGYIYLNVKNGRIYISYEGSMEDEEGNLLVLDHPMINEYYEYALKDRILQNLYMSGEPLEQKMVLIKQELRAARNNALGIVNTPDFAEIKEVHDMNRKAMYRKYFSPFESH